MIPTTPLDVTRGTGSDARIVTSPTRTPSRDFMQNNPLARESGTCIKANLYVIGNFTKGVIEVRLEV